MSVAEIAKNSEILKYITQAKVQYAEYRGNGKGIAKSVGNSIFNMGKNFGLKNGVLAGIGAIGGTVLVPVPGGAIVGAEFMLKQKTPMKQIFKSIVQFLR